MSDYALPEWTSESFYIVSPSVVSIDRDKKSFSLSGAGNKSNDTCTVYGRIVIPSESKGIHHWEFETCSTSGTLAIGIDDSCCKWKKKAFYDRSGTEHHAFRCNGWKWSKSGSPIQYGIPFGTGNSVIMTLNLNTATLSFAVDGENQGIAWNNVTKKDELSYRMAVSFEGKRREKPIIKLLRYWNDCAIQKAVNSLNQKASEKLPKLQVWINQITSHNFSNFFVDIKNGVVLCELLNNIKPGTCKKFQVSHDILVQRVNVGIFLAGCKKFGVSDNHLFETRDLVDFLNLNKVVLCLYALTKEVEDYNVPIFEWDDECSSMVKVLLYHNIKTLIRSFIFTGKCVMCHHYIDNEPYSNFCVQCGQKRMRKICGDKDIKIKVNGNWGISEESYYDSDYGWAMGGTSNKIYHLLSGTMMYKAGYSWTMGGGDVSRESGEKNLKFVKSNECIVQYWKKENSQWTSDQLDLSKLNKYETLNWYKFI